MVSERVQEPIIETTFDDVVKSRGASYGAGTKC